MWRVIFAFVVLACFAYIMLTLAGPDYGKRKYQPYFDGDKRQGR